MAIDPVCGMKVNERTAKIKAIKNGKEYFFCSNHCRREFLSKGTEKVSGFGKILPTLLVLLLIIMSFLSSLYDFMPKFMGWFFIVVSILKMLDWRGFADSFSMYDIIAKKSRAYALAYPAIEFLLGVLFLLGYAKPGAIATFIIMSVGTVGVAKNLMSESPVKCACLGTLINIPLTKFTLVEDLLMAAMALMVLIF